MFYPIISFYAVTEKLFDSILSFYTAVIFCTNRKAPSIHFLQNLKHPILEPLWAPFGLKSSKIFFPRKRFCSFLSLHILITLNKKSGKFYALNFDNSQKTSFWAHFGPFMVQKLEEKGIPKKLIGISFNSLCHCNFMQLSQKSHMKNLTGPILDSLLPQNLKTKCF